MERLSLHLRHPRVLLPFLISMLMCFTAIFLFAEGLFVGPLREALGFSRLSAIGLACLSIAQVHLLSLIWAIPAHANWSLPSIPLRAGGLDQLPGNGHILPEAGERGNRRLRPWSTGRFPFIVWLMLLGLALVQFVLALSSQIGMADVISICEMMLTFGGIVIAISRFGGNMPRNDAASGLT